MCSYGTDLSAKVSRHVAVAELVACAGLAGKAGTKAGVAAKELCLTYHNSDTI